MGFEKPTIPRTAWARVIAERNSRHGLIAFSLLAMLSAICRRDMALLPVSRLRYLLLSAYLIISQLRGDAFSLTPMPAEALFRRHFF